jgi:hypothetical protein
MKITSDTFPIAFALILGVALAVVAIPIVVIVCFSALAFIVVKQSVRRQRHYGDVVSRSRKGPAGQSRVPPTIETTYTVVHPS